MARALGLLPLEDFPAVAVQDAQRDRLGRELETCGGDDCVRHIQPLHLDLAQNQQSMFGRSANELDPKRLRLR